MVAFEFIRSQFRKLAMHLADLLIVDANPTTPFDFSLARYNAQLVAGYSQSTSTLGLVVHMPDLRSLARTGRAPANAPTHARATTR